MDAQETVTRFNRWSPEWATVVQKAEDAYWNARRTSQSESAALRAAIETALDLKS